MALMLTATNSLNDGGSMIGPTGWPVMVIGVAAISSLPSEVTRMMHGQVNYSLASSFLREIPDELLHWITPRVAVRKPDAFAFSPQRSGPVAAPVQRSVNSVGWRIGQTVNHGKFGEGIIVNIEGGGADARVQVNFRNTGTKWLALEYAKLAAA